MCCKSSRDENKGLSLCRSERPESPFFRSNFGHSSMQGAEYNDLTTIYEGKQIIEGNVSLLLNISVQPLEVITPVCSGMRKNKFTRKPMFSPELFEYLARHLRSSAFPLFESFAFSVGRKGQ